MHEVVLMTDENYKDFPVQWQKVIVFEITKFFLPQIHKGEPLNTFPNFILKGGVRKKVTDAALCWSCPMEGGSRYNKAKPTNVTRPQRGARKGRTGSTPGV